MELLYFQFDRGPYALPLEAVADVTLAGTIQHVPLSPPAVKGLAERRGRPIAVIDLPHLLDDTFRTDRIGAHLVRLARPLDGTAFWVPAEVFSGDGVPASADESRAAGGHVFIDGRLHVLLDAEALVKRAAAFS
jgi:chemotaxis signal transduction protein